MGHQVGIHTMKMREITAFLSEKPIFLRVVLDRDPEARLGGRTVMKVLKGKNVTEFILSRGVAREVTIE